MRRVVLITILCFALLIVSLADSSGPRSAGSGATSSVNPVGTEPWVNPGNIAGENSVYATYSATGCLDTQWLVATNFGFSIPSNAIITGIQVDILWYCPDGQNNFTTFAGGTDDLKWVRYVKAGSVDSVGSGNHVGACADSPVYSSTGGDGDLWDTTWTPAQINASNFGFAMAVHALDCITSNVAVDNFRATVFFTLPTSAPRRPIVMEETRSR